MQYAALMDQSTAALALAIGVRVRQERQARHWTLDQLAEAAGASGWRSPKAACALRS